MKVPTVSMSRILNAPETPRCSDSNDINVPKIRPISASTKLQLDMPAIGL